MIRHRAWLGGALVALVAVLGGCRESESAFCSDLRRVDTALGALRDAKARDDFGSVPELVDDVADAYEGIEPPPVLQGDWATAIEFFRHQGEDARSLLTQGQLPETPAEQEARYSQAFTNITDYGVAHCGRARGQLVP